MEALQYGKTVPFDFYDAYCSKAEYFDILQLRWIPVGLAC